MDIPDAFAKKLEYDDSTHLVVFKGIMASDEHDALIGLSPEEPFQKAIEALYRTSQQLREQRDDRTYQLHMVQEATLSVEHLDRHYKLTVLEINLRTQEIRVRLEVRAAPQHLRVARRPGPVRANTPPMSPWRQQSSGWASTTSPWWIISASPMINAVRSSSTPLKNR